MAAGKTDNFKEQHVNIKKSYLDVANRDDEARHEKLQHETDDREHFACGLFGPVLRADHLVGVVEHTFALINGQGHADENGDEPHGHNDEHAQPCLHARYERVHDHEVAVHGNSGARQSRHVHTHTHRHGQDLAQGSG